MVFIPPVENVDDGRAAVQVQGSASVLNRNTASHAHMHYHDGQLEFFMHAHLPNPTLSAGDRRRLNARKAKATPKALRAVGDGFVHLPDLLPAGEMPAGYEDLYLKNVMLIVSAQNATDPMTGLPVPAGLSVNGQADTTAHNSTKLDVFARLYSAFASVPGTVFGTLVNITGALRPYVHLNSTSPIGVKYPIGQYVTVENVTVDIKPFAEEVVASAVLTVTPKGFAPLLVDLFGNLSLTAHTVVLNGNQRGEWPIPGMVDKLNISRGGANMSLNFDPKKNLSFVGNFGAQINYGDLTAFVDLELPPVGHPTDGGFALEAVVHDKFNLHNLPGVKFGSAAATFPQTVALNGALVFCNYSGAYTLNTPDAPVPTMSVVPGLNMLAYLDIAGSPGLKTSVPRLQRGSAAQPASHLVATGYIKTNGDFLLAASIDNVFLGLNSDLDVQHANISIGTSKPHLTLGALLSITGSIVGSKTDVTFDVEGAFDNTSIALDGALSSDWEVNIGTEEFDIDGVSFDYSEKDRMQNGAKVVDMAGDIAGYFNVSSNNGAGVANKTFMLRVSYPGSVLLSRKCPMIEVEEVTQISLAEVLSIFMPHEKHSFDVDAGLLGELLHTNWSAIDFRISPGCDNLTISATMNTSTFGKANVGLMMHKTCDANSTTVCNNGTWKWHMYFAPAVDWELSSSKIVPPSFPELKFTLPTFVLSSAAEDIYIPVDLGRSAIVVQMGTVQGLNLKARLLIKQSAHMSLVSKLAPSLLELDLTGWFTTYGWSVAAVFSANSTADLGSKVQLTGAGLNITARTKAPTSDSLMITGTLLLPNPLVNNDVLEMHAEADVGLGATADTFTISASLKDHSAPAIRIPIGHAGLNITSLSASLTVSESNTTALTGYVFRADSCVAFA